MRQAAESLGRGSCQAKPPRAPRRTPRAAIPPLGQIGAGNPPGVLPAPHPLTSAPIFSGFAGPRWGISAHRQSALVAATTIRPLEDPQAWAWWEGVPTRAWWCSGARRTWWVLLQAAGKLGRSPWLLCEVWWPSLLFLSISSQATSRETDGGWSDSGMMDSRHTRLPRRA
jgi:hypothetical protein